MEGGKMRRVRIMRGGQEAKKIEGGWGGWGPQGPASLHDQTSRLTQHCQKAPENIAGSSHGPS